MNSLPARPARSAQVLLRSVTVLLACLGLAAVSLAATSGSGKDPGAAVVSAAADRLGDTYVWGGAGPDSWDCSGFTSTLWRQVGGVKDVPRTSRQQQAWAVPIPVEQATPGDLVFFGDPVTHVGLVEKRSTAKAGSTVTMLDASSSQKGVVRRAVWKSGVVRYGRVPRKGMTPVSAWASPSASPSASPKPSASPSPSAKPTPTPTTAPRSSAAPRSTVRAALAGLPAQQRVASSAIAAKAAKLAKAAVGNTTLTDVELIRNVWRRAGGAVLPGSRTGLNGAAHRVPVADARVGDLIVYAAPGSHVGIYVGNGLMVDASRQLGEVVLRQVWDAPGVQIMRLSR